MRNNAKSKDKWNSHNKLISKSIKEIITPKKITYNISLNSVIKKASSNKNRNYFKTMINKEIDLLHWGIESPIQRIPNKPWRPKVKIRNDKVSNKKWYLNKPYNRQVVVGFRAATNGKYHSLAKNNTNSYLTNFSSVYSPGTENGSASLLSKEKSSK